MCGRFYVADDEQNELLAALIREASRRQQALTGQVSIATGEVLPSATVAALVRGKSGGEAAFPMQWGFHLEGKRGLLINTRSETALQKPLFRASMLERRCLIPASWYYEWETRDGQQSLLDVPAPARNARKVKYAIRPKQAGLMYLAGIYRYEAESPLPVFSILTREAAPGIAFIHPRMPVIFLEEHCAQWLHRDADPERVLAVCQTEMTAKA